MSDAYVATRDKCSKVKKNVDSLPTLFNSKNRPGLMVIDEIHTFRNGGQRHNAIVTMAEFVNTVIGLSATPVVTRPQVSTRQSGACYIITDTI
jgi:superfamily II DNA or RNA helicase